MTDLSLHLVQQRDVQPGTMEEYMAKNARLAEWNNRVRVSICILFFVFFAYDCFLFEILFEW